MLWAEELLFATLYTYQLIHERGHRNKKVVPSRLEGGMEGLRMGQIGRPDGLSKGGNTP